MLGVDDASLLTMMHAADVAAIDAPFGWPDAFREAVSGWTLGGTWNDAASLQPRLRYTDQVQRDHGRSPLSISADRIAMTAMRRARILTAHHATADTPLDRVGRSVIEVYPAASLIVWEIDVTGDKAPGANTRRRAMVDRLIQDASLNLSATTIDRCAATGHALDALVSALTAYAHHLGLTEPPPSQHVEQIAREGDRPGRLDSRAGTRLAAPAPRLTHNKQNTSSRGIRAGRPLGGQPTISVRNAHKGASSCSANSTCHSARASSSSNVMISGSYRLRL